MLGTESTAKAPLTAAPPNVKDVQLEPLVSDTESPPSVAAYRLNAVGPPEPVVG